MLTEEHQLRRSRERNGQGTGFEAEVRSERQTPLVLNSNFITTDLSIVGEGHVDWRTGALPGDYVQPKWEDAARSTNAERGSVGSVSLDVNLVLASSEYRDGMVIKRFREFARLDGEAETKSISNRSVISESSRLNTMSFRPFRPAEEMDDRSHHSLTKDGQPLGDDTKSEQLFLAGASHRKEPMELNLVPQKVLQSLKQSDDMSSQLRTNGFGSKTPRKVLEGVPLESNGREQSKEAGFPLASDPSITDPRKRRP